MTHPMYISGCHEVTPLRHRYGCHGVTSHPYVIAIYSNVLPYSIHTVVTHPYLREIVLPKVQRSRSLSPDSVAKWCQSPKVTLSHYRQFLYYYLVIYDIGPFRISYTPVVLNLGYSCHLWHFDQIFLTLCLYFYVTLLTQWCKGNDTQADKIQNNCT